jgi:MraZ protein
LFGSAAMLEFDKNGRILIPQFLRNTVKLESAVKLVGIGPYFEIWTPDFWNKKHAMIEDGETRAKMFEDLDLTLKNA